MSVRTQIIKSHRALVEELLNQKSPLNNEIKSEIKEESRSAPVINTYLLRKKPVRKRELTPDSSSNDNINDDYSEYSDESDCNDNFIESTSSEKKLFEIKPENTTSNEMRETVLEEITIVHDNKSKSNSLNNINCDNQKSVELEPTSDSLPGVKSEENEDIKEPLSVSTPSVKRRLTKRNMIAASNKILGQSSSMRDRRYSNVVFIRKSRRDKIEKQNQSKTTPKKEKVEDPNVFIKNGKKYAACEICKKEVKKHYMKYHMTTHFPKHFSCDVCGATTRNLRGLRYHKLYWHSSKLDYICDKCGKKYRSKHALDLHNKKEHGGERDLECNICGKKFFQKMHLKRHVDGIHKKLRPHKCEYCGKDFTKRTHLVTHWRTHTNETPYSCDMCGERFKLKLSLKNHLKRVHSFEEEERVFCNVCNRGFASEQGLRAHINSRVHEGQKCQYCSEIFTQEYLKTHLRDVHFHDVDYF